MNKLVKRLFDITMSLLALVVLSPVLILTAIGIKLSSRGPVFYMADRVGIYGTHFKMYKFRSMHVETSAVEKSFIVDSDRVFALGSFIRKSKIDELPQLLNILKGDMTIVGPRPASTSNVDELYVGKYKDIQNVKPGLTSYASLFDYKHGELFVEDNDTYISEILPVRLELELYYANTWNFAVDLYLIFFTVGSIIQVVFGKKEFEFTMIEKKFIEEHKREEKVLEVV